ncbi:histidinol dehydrogenase [Candidatus Nitrosotalea okcheonensis]|uniref:Histidinol dehydrogenase n=1 Tax=Candidatus Nitrosotalea okcheonensis TaxID=1903276 RepID=A0A2H1FGJ8_9ARCH|nr:histidinol dehydrogenase [Candidatus Nitrosotalea okcheonensis]SMH71890.1 Histidinol dehydrogenase [Candidatus Nitrosotalea okcheonensis]
MRIIDIKNMDSIIESVRPKTNNTIRQQVLSIISDVQKRKDKALKEYETKFTGVKTRSLKITQQEIKSAYLQVTKEQIAGIRIAKTRLEKSENVIRKKLQDVSVTIDGIVIKKIFLPIDTVGCYIPGGKARYPSTIVMSAVPAKVAGVKKIIAVSPSNEKGKIDPLTLVAGDICGVDEFYRIGGAQAIAALAYGTESIPQVDKIVGPGGVFVTLAKSFLSEVVSIDMIAGPTELAILADSTADAEFVALDLISQAEHSPDTMCCLITNSSILKNKVLKLLQKKIKTIKRSSIVKESLQKNGFIAICNTEQQMVNFANRLAPEHLEIITKKPQQVAKKITSAGLTLVGKNTPSSASDYLLGSNHILPTNRFGRTRGSLGVLDYMKIQTQIESSESALKKISKYMKALTEAEGLTNHYEAVKGRLS